jgi:hypothetical protein
MREIRTNKRRKLNRFAIVLDTLMATHHCDETQLLKDIGKRRDRKTIRTIRIGERERLGPERATI